LASLTAKCPGALESQILPAFSVFLSHRAENDPSLR
jgi:hypothetical protein